MEQTRTLYPYEIRKILSRRGHIHLIGIGGSMMSGIAELLFAEGFPVSGSDTSESSLSRLLKIGITAYSSHDEKNITPDITLCIYSSAVSEDNPERLTAKAQGIPTLSRAEFLGAYMTAYAVRVGVSGTHGKSTTTALLDYVAEGASACPTTLLGATLPGISASVRHGEKKLLLYEACEYRDSFLHFFPTHEIFLNMEWDHTDYFKSETQMRFSFLRAMERAEHTVIVNADDEGLKALVDQTTVPVFTFGKDKGADLRISDLIVERGHCRFSAFFHGFPLGEFYCGELSDVGYVHAGAVISFGILSGFDVSLLKEKIASFPGIPRRLEVLKRTEKQTVYYDYAHHPSEISAVIGTLKKIGGAPVSAVFRPHTYTRTRDLFDDFCKALGTADAVIVTDVFAARETPIFGIGGQALANGIGKRAKYVPLEALRDAVSTLSDTVVLLGAGDFGTLPENLKKST